MAYNPRMSIARPTPSGKSRVRQQEEDSFMTLSEKEIAGCINDIGIAFTVQDLQRPNPQQIQRVFEWFAELLMNATRDVVAPSMAAAAEAVGGQYSEIFTNDTRDLVGFFVTLRRLLAECGVHDFTFQDLHRPTTERLVRIFSYDINFVRFRESQTAAMDENFGRAERTKRRVEQLWAERHTKEERLAELERGRARADAAVRGGEARSDALKAKLYELKAGQERVSEGLERARGEQGRLKGALEERTARALQLRADIDRLRPYTEQAPAALEAALAELNRSLAADRAQIEALERRARALRASADAFGVATSDVDGCVALLHDLQRDLAAEEATLAAAARNRDALSARSDDVREVERRERHLAKQLEGVQARASRLRARAGERRDADAARMAELRAQGEDLRAQRERGAREMERRRVRIEQTEKKMAELRESVESEVKAAQDEYLKMDAHVRLYVKEMEQSLA